MPEKETIDQFCHRAIELLRMPVSRAIPAGSEFAEGEVPELVVYLGATSGLAAIRARLPESSFLLSLHYPEAEPLLCGGRTLSGELSDDHVEYATRAGLLTSLLPEKRVKLLGSPGFREAHPEVWEQTHLAIKTALDNAVSDERRGLIRLRAACSNLKKMLTGSRMIPLTGLADYPAVLCGAGPSLSANLDTLKALQGRAILVAVGHAVRTLAEAGIVPDVVVEGDALAGRNWPKELAPDTVLVATVEVAPEVAGRFDRIVWCAGSSFIFNGVATRYGVPLFAVTLDKTVSVHALDFMLRMGLRKIALVGQDYCFAADGRLYAEASKGSALDDLFELPAACGEGTVRANYTLVMLRDAMNRFLDGTTKMEGLELTNVSGGAHLNRTRVEAFHGWAERVQVEAIPPLFREESPGDDTRMLDTISDELRRGAALLEAIRKSCRALTSELDQHPVKMERVRKRQQQLTEAMAAESGHRGDAVSADWMNMLLSVADRIMKESPGVVSEENDPLVQLNYLNRRYSMTQRLFGDLLDCLTNSGDPHDSEAFREEGLAVLRRCNPVFARQVEACPRAMPEGYDIHWINQILPYVKKYAGGEWVELSGCISIFKEAADYVSLWAEKSQFDPRSDGVTVVAPGNWVYVLELVRRYPGIELAVIEPWSELLAQLIRRGSFLHKLPLTALVVSTWADPVYMKRRGEWNRRGMRKLLFVAPHLASFPDVAVLVKNMGVLP